MTRRSVVVLLGLLAACRSGAPPAPPEPEAEHAEEQEDIVLTPDQLRNAGVKVALAERRSLPHVLELTGELAWRPSAVYHVSPRLAGNVIRPLVEVGQTVKASEPLAEIRSADLAELRATFLAARSRVSVLRQNVQRLQRLRKTQLALENDLVEARGALATVEAEMLASKERLRAAGLAEAEIEAMKFGEGDFTRLIVVAPASGRILELHASPGERVAPDEKLAVLADPSALDLWVHVSNKDVAHIHEGSPVEVRSPAWPDEVFPGVVDLVGSEVDPRSRLLRTRVRVPNPKGLLKPGLLVRAAIQEKEPAGEHTAPGHTESHGGPQVVVPSSAVRTDAQGAYVFVQEAPGRFRKQRVTTGTSSGGFVAIEDGLEAGATVVTAGGFVVSSQGKKSSLGHGHAH